MPPVSDDAAQQPIPARRRVAAFDFDGTLVRRDTLVPFLLRVAGRREAVRFLAAEAPRALRRRLGPTAAAAPGRDTGDGVAPDAAAAAMADAAAELEARDAFKRRVFRHVFAGRDPAEVAELGRAYAAELPRLLRPPAVRTLAWHRSRRHELVIVSASLLAYLGPLAEALGFDHVIAVELEADGRGRLTGELAGPNVRGPEKAVRLRQWLGEDAYELWAYGDSDGDTELLAMADHPSWVGRRAPHG